MIYKIISLIEHKAADEFNAIKALLTPSTPQGLYPVQGLANTPKGWPPQPDVFEPPEQPTDIKIHDIDAFIKDCSQYGFPATKTALFSRLDATASILGAIKAKGGGIPFNKDNAAREIFKIMSNENLTPEEFNIYWQVGIRTRTLLVLLALNATGGLLQWEQQRLESELKKVYYFSTIAPDGSDVYKLGNFGKMIDARLHPDAHRNLGEDWGASIVEIKSGKKYNVAKHRSFYGFSYEETWLIVAPPGSKGVLRYIDPKTNQMVDIELKNGTRFTLPCNSAFKFKHINGLPLTGIIVNKTMWRVLENGSNAYQERPTQEEINRFRYFERTDAESTSCWAPLKSLVTFCLSKLIPSRRKF